MTTPQQLSRWEREFQLNGFVVLRNLIPVASVQQMAEQLAPVIQAQWEQAQQDEFKQGRGAGRLAFDVGSFARFMKAGPWEQEYLSNPVVHALLDRVLGAGGWRTHWTNVEVCFPGSRYMGWHSDQTPDETPDMDGPHQTVRTTFNIPLVDFGWANGAMEILPGSHLLPRSFSITQPIQEIAHIYPHRLELRLGDAILRDGNGLHRGAPNLTDVPRPMLDHTYRRS